MPRPKRLQIAGGIYHVGTRGNRRGPIFLDDGDRERFLALLAEIVERLGWRCHAYCLMQNHYHLLVETPAGDIAAGMQQLNGNYARWFNAKYNYTGHLFERRYWDELVTEQRHLLWLVRYIALNPVRAGLCRRPAAWKWSSYRALVQLVRRPAFLSTWLLEQFAEDDDAARSRVRAFLRANAPRRTRGP
jgi:REP element-mobilizing transposase RayT